MPARTPFSIRLDPDTQVRLEAAAVAAGAPRAVLASKLIKAALEGAAGQPVDQVEEHPIVAKTVAMFSDLEGRDFEAQREAAIIFPRVAAAGGPGAVAAVRELRSIYAEVDRLTSDGGGWS